jgi:type II secretory pathway pseudopilin PulG
MTARRAFALVELLITMTLIGLLVRLAIPRYSDMKRRATAAAIMGDIHAIRIAAFTNYTETGSFPVDAANGELPSQLISNLPAGFSFDRTDFDYSWRAWTAVNASGSTEALVGVTVRVNDPRLATRLVLGAGSGYLPLVTPNSVTFLLNNGDPTKTWNSDKKETSAKPVAGLLEKK